MCDLLICFKAQNHILHVFFISQHWYNSLKLSSWNTRTCLCYTINSLAADDLATQGSGASKPSIDLVLTEYFGHSTRIVNSLAPGRFEWKFRQAIFKSILVIDGWTISCWIVLNWMSLDLTEDKSTLVQVMAWCRQATSHYLSQCWPRSVLPYDVPRSQWVKCLFWHKTMSSCHSCW